MKKLLFVSFIFICIILIGGSALFGAGPYQPYDSQDEINTALERMDESHFTGTDDETPAMVYSATKNLHTTGKPQDVNIMTWQLRVEGEKIETTFSFSYEDLKKMNMVKKEVTLICPGVFIDYAEWEGVLLSDILAQAGIQDDYKKITVHGLDGYRNSLSHEQIDTHLIFLALKVNGVTLPREHGYPVRIVAEELDGNKWVKWVDRIEVE
jgi:DMSO/TMAO reductase YedYZ molybdopterin-dependent catalytic subunit